jgi:hypothetical protein
MLADRQIVSTMYGEIKTYISPWRHNILLTHGKHLHDRTISLRGEVWAHKTSLPHFLLPVSSKEIERSCIYVLGGINDASFYDFLYWILEMSRQYGISCFFHFISLGNLSISRSSRCNKRTLFNKHNCSNPVHGKVYSIQHYVIMFVSYLATGRWFFIPVFRFPPPIKLTAKI